jgi:hypothetical protein
VHLGIEVDFNPIPTIIKLMYNADYKIGKDLMEAIGEDMVKSGTINMDTIVTLSQDSVYGNLGVHIDRKDAEESIIKGMLRAMRN